MLNDLMTLAAPYGPVGLLCAYFVWREEKRDKRDADREKRDTEREKRQEQTDKDRIEADKALAVSMTLLAERHR